MKKRSHIISCVFSLTLFSTAVIAGQEYFCIDETSQRLDNFDGVVSLNTNQLLKEKVSFNSDMSKMFAGTTAPMEYACKANSMISNVYCSYDNGVHHEWFSLNTKSLSFMRTTLTPLAGAFSGSVILGRCYKL